MLTPTAERLGVREHKREGQIKGGETVEEDKEEIDSQSGKEKYKENTNGIFKVKAEILSC